VNNGSTSASHFLKPLLIVPEKNQVLEPVKPLPGLDWPLTFDENKVVGRQNNE